MGILIISVSKVFLYKWNVLNVKYLAQSLAHTNYLQSITYYYYEMI
jgi:hypothetical protein